MSEPRYTWLLITLFFGTLGLAHDIDKSKKEIIKVIEELRSNVKSN